jgi:hypothetical protein
MERLQDTILGNKGFAKGIEAPMTNLVHGGQFGHAPNPGQYINNGAYVRTNTIAILLEAPRVFQHLPDPQVWIENLKNFIELHSRTIDGLQWGLTVDSAEQAFGGGQEMQSTPTNVTRARSEPTHVMDEKYGIPGWHLFDGWIRNGIMDPETKFSALVADGANSPADMLPDFYSMTVLYIEPDPTFKYAVKAWLITNMYPKELTSYEGRKDQTSAYEPIELSVPFTGIQQVGKGVNALANRKLKEMVTGGMDPNRAPAFISKVDSDVKAGNGGYEAALKTASSVAIR